MVALVITPTKFVAGDVHNDACNAMLEPKGKRHAALERIADTLLGASDKELNEKYAAATENNDMRPRAEELGLRHVWYSRYKGDVGDVTLTFAGGKDFGIHVTAFTEFGGKRSALAQVRTTLKRARELGYEAWCCDNNPNNGGYIAPKKAQVVKGE